MNNLKLIRETYGATQEQIATALGVNRVTVANWESGASIASNSNQEKMSIYYGISPEFFYTKELTDSAVQLIQRTAERAKAIEEKSHGERNKEEDFQKTFNAIPFAKVMRDYAFAMKMLLATADRAELDKLKTAALIHEKMGKRLTAIIALREEENSSEEPSLYDLMDQVDNDKG